MRVLVISAPDSSLADSLFSSGIDSLLCVTQDDVYLRSGPEGVVSGRDIGCPQKIEIDIPAVKARLLQAYPLIDRWVGRNQSISTSIGLLLEYTVTLIRIIGNHPPHVAVLETGAPHHLFSYCLDVALNYLGIRTYYLYGNAFDGRCVVFDGSRKNGVVGISDYSAERAIDEYIGQVRRAATYTPADSTRSLSPFLHKSPLYAAYLHLRHMVAKYRHRLLRRRSFSGGGRINLRLPYLGLFEVISVLNAHKKYLAMISQGGFQPGEIRPGDIVYVGHMVPEATSFPESPDYPDELDVLIDLKNRFPESRIYYREHPAIGIFSEFGHVHFQGLHKCPTFYRQMADMGITVIPASMHISKIRERGCLFATKTGRVAVENSVLGIATIIYGHPFYGIDLPLAFHVSKLSSCSTVQGIKDMAAAIPEPAESVKRYLVEMFSGTLANPGISLYANPSARPEFEASFVRLVDRLCAGNESLYGECRN